MKKSKRIRLAFLTLIMTILCVRNASATEFWTVDIDWVGVTAAGTYMMNIAGTPTGGAGTWRRCSDNWIYFHKHMDSGVLVNTAPHLADAMLRTATAAFLSSTQIRVGLDRDTDGKCYTKQVLLQK